MGKIYLFNLFAESHENFFEITDRTKNSFKKTSLHTQTAHHQFTPRLRLRTHTLFNGTTKRKQNIDVIADLATNYIRPAVNVCSLQVPSLYFVPLKVYNFESIISVTLPARPCVTYQILTPLAGTWKFSHLFFFLRFVFIFKSVQLRNFVPIGLRLQNLTPKRQFPGTKDISSLRDAEKTVFFSKSLRYALFSNSIE